MDAECRHILTELQLYLDGECPEHVHRVVHLHLRDCRGCLSRADFERALRACLADCCTEAAPADLARRIAAALEQAV